MQEAKDFRKIFQESIEKQFGFNQGKNLFYKGTLGSLKFSPETLKAIEYIDLIDPDSETFFVNHLTERAIEEFCKTNQYYAFDQSSRDLLRNIYTELFSNLKKQDTPIESIAAKHFDRLIQWLQTTNPFAEKMNSSQESLTIPVACSEYSPGIQKDILNLNIEQLAQPVLDIGCGKQGSLVLFLRQKGIEAYGFDRFAFDHPFLSNFDWFDYPFEKDKWGTITSHLGFSNHFLHHHLRKDGNYIAYAKKYMDILNSLKIGGCFQYAPDLPFVEPYLDKEKFQLTKQDIGAYPFKSSSVKRLR